MAVSCTKLIETPDSGNTPNTTGSFTPTAGDLLIFVVGTAASVTDSNDVPSASANGITFSAVTVGAVHAIFNGSAYSLDLYVADQLVPASPSAMTITWDPTDGGTSTIMGVYALSGMINAGTAAIRQFKAQENGTAGNTPTLVFNQSMLTTTTVLVAVANLSAPASVTEPSLYAELSDTNCTTPTVGLEVAWKTTSPTTVTWGSTSATAYGAVGVELIGPFSVNITATRVSATAAMTRPQVIARTASPAKSNTCEGSNGVAVTTSNSSGPTQFDAVTLTGTATATYDTSSKHSGSAAIKLDSLGAGTPSRSAQVTWDFTSTFRYFARGYFYLDNADGGSEDTVLIGSPNTTNVPGYAAVQPNGALWLRHGDVGVWVQQWASPMGAIPYGAWFRLELDRDDLLGLFQARVYKGTNIDGLVPDVVVGTLTDSLPAESASQLDFGWANTNQSGTNGPVWLDELAVNFTGQIEPPSASPDANISAAVIAVATSVPAPALHTSETVSASVVSSATAIAQPTITSSAFISPSVVACVGTVAAPTVTAQQNATVAPTVVTAVTTLTTPAITSAAEITISGTVTAAVVISAPTVVVPVELRNTLEGTPSDVITTSNTAGPDQFTYAYTSASYFDNTHHHGGNTSLRFQANAEYVGWSTLPGVPQAYSRFYGYLHSLPSLEVQLALGFYATEQYFLFSVNLLPNGKLRLRGIDNAVIADTTAVVSLDAWFRIEFSATNFTGSTHDLWLALYSGSNLETNTADAGGTLSATTSSVGVIYTATFVSEVGFTVTDNSFTINFGDYWLDDVGVSSQAALGSSVTSVDASVDATVVVSVVSVGSPTVTAQQNATVAPTVVNVVTTFAEPTVTAQQNASISPSVVQVSTVVPAPTLHTSETVSPSVVQVSTAVPTPTLHTSETVSPSVVQVSTAVPAPTLHTSETVSPSVVQVSTAVPTPTLHISETVSPSVVQVSTAVPTPTITSSVLISPSTVQVGISILTPTFYSDVSITAIAVSGTTNIPTPVFSSSAAITSIQVSGTTSIPTPAISVGVTVSAEVVSSTISIPTPTVFANVSVEIAATVVSSSVSIPTPDLSVGSVVPAAVVSSVTTIPTPSVSTGADVTISPSTVLSSTSIPDVTITATQTANVTATVVLSSIVIDTPVITAMKSVNISASVITATTVISTATVSAGSTIQAVAVQASVVIETPVVFVSDDVLITAVTVNATVDIPLPTVEVEAHVVISAVVIFATVLIPEVIVTAGVSVLIESSVVIAITEIFTPVIGAVINPIPIILRGIDGPVLSRRVLGVNITVTEVDGAALSRRVDGLNTSLLLDGVSTVDVDVSGVRLSHETDGLALATDEIVGPGV